jgi:hypothetical protein
LLLGGPDVVADLKHGGVQVGLGLQRRRLRVGAAESSPGDVHYDGRSDRIGAGVEEDLASAGQLRLGPGDGALGRRGSLVGLVGRLGPDLDSSCGSGGVGEGVCVDAARADDVLIEDGGAERGRAIPVGVLVRSAGAGATTTATSTATSADEPRPQQQGEEYDEG